MRVGFTGTRAGATDTQFAAFCVWLVSSGATDFHHGCCSGADADVGVHVYDGYPSVRVVGYPSDLKDMTDPDARQVSRTARAAAAAGAQPGRY